MHWEHQGLTWHWRGPRAGRREEEEAGTGKQGWSCACSLTMLGEEVAVHDLNEAVKLLDGQAAHGHVQDELGEELAAHTEKLIN